MPSEPFELASLHFLDSMIENIPHMIFIKDARDLRFVRFNKAGQELLGYPQNDMIGKNVYDLFPKEEADFFTSKDRLVLEGRKLVDIPEEPVHTRLKGTRILHTKKIPILDEKGNPKYLLGISVDITEKKSAEEKLLTAHHELRKSEQQFRTLVSNIPGAIYRCACDKAWTMFFLSDMIEEISGYPAGDFLRNQVRSFASIIHEDDRQMVEDKVLEAVKKKKPYVLEYRIIHKNGGVRWVYEKGQGVFSEDEDLLWLDGAIFDITDQKLAREELVRSHTEKEQIEIFTYLASHDLQEPLQKIISFSELLKNQKNSALDPKSRDYLERMQNSVRRMTQLVQDLLNLSRIVTKRPSFETVDLTKVFQEVLSDLELRLEKTGAKVESDTLPVIRADRSQMYQLFQNLISNSIKFRKRGDPPVIRILSRLLEDGRLQMQFQDNGIGFEERDVERIFKPFERLHSWVEYEGSGIGLALCQRIVSRHGGQISAKSAPGRGATFTVTLPTGVEFWTEPEAVGSHDK